VKRRQKYDIMVKNEIGDSEMEINEIIRELDKKLIVGKTEISKDTMYICCQREPKTAECPYCGTISGKLHSKYRREIADLPIAQYKVKLVIEVKKYTCSNSYCGHKRFVESQEKHT